jgi:D-alanyl-D-alanine dipeptidase
MRRLLVVACLVSPARAAPAPDELVDVSAVIPDAVIDLRYATKDNFTGEVLYPNATCKLRRAVAERLVKAAALLRAQDRRLLVWDCYRPASIQAELWKRVPDERYVANPKKGSRHSRGAAIDVALVDRDGNAVVLPTSFDDFSRAAHRKHALRGARGVEARRLSAAMVKVGFVPMPTEWWHYDAPDASKLPISDE